MTRYTVVWVRSAQNELAQIWQDASDRIAVTNAADAIDNELSEDAILKGSALSEGLHSEFMPPLKVIFTVSEEDRLVEVLRVRHV